MKNDTGIFPAISLAMLKVHSLLGIIPENDRTIGHGKAIET